MCRDEEIQELGQDTVASLDPDYHWAPGLRAVYWVDTPHYRGIARIVCADGLKYDYSFGEKPQTVELGLADLDQPRRERRKQQQAALEYNLSKNFTIG